MGSLDKNFWAFFKTGKLPAGMMVQHGTFSSVAGVGIQLKSTRTSAYRVCADDGGTLLGESAVRAILGRTLVTISHSNETSIFGVQGQCKIKAPLDCTLTTGNRAGTWSYIEIAGTATKTVTLSGSNKVTAGAFAMVDWDGTGALTLSSGHILAGVAALTNVTKTGGTFTQTGIFAAFAAVNNSTASYSAFAYGLYLASGAITTGVYVGDCTTGISVAGASTTGISVTGSATDAIKIATGTFTDAIDISGTVTNAVHIGACTTGINIDGAVTTGISITGNATDAIKISTGTITTAINVDVGIVDIATRLVMSGVPTDYTASTLAVGVYGTPIVDTTLVDNILASINFSTATNKTAADTSCMAAYIGCSNTAATTNNKIQGLLVSTTLHGNLYDGYAVQGHITVHDALATQNANAHITGISGKALLSANVTQGWVTGGLFILDGTGTVTGLCHGVAIVAEATGPTGVDALLYAEAAVAATSAIEIAGAANITNVFKFNASAGCVDAHSAGSATSGLQLIIDIGGSPYALAVCAVGT